MTRTLGQKRRIIRCNTALRVLFGFLVFGLAVPSILQSVSLSLDTEWKHEQVSQQLDLPMVQQAVNSHTNSSSQIVPQTSKPTSNAFKPNRRFSSSSCNKIGCIIIFFHIPKTGGTTLFETFSQYKHKTRADTYFRFTGTSYVLIGGSDDSNTTLRGRKYYRQRQFQYRRDIVGNNRDVMLAEIEQSMQVLEARNQQHQDFRQQTGDNTMLYFFEFHAGKNPSFQSLVQDGSIPNWKTRGKQSNFDVFTFTILREPISWSLSAYHMICVIQEMCKKPPRGPPSKGIQGRVGPKKRFEIAMQSNPQCTFLIQAGFPLNVRNTYRPNQAACNTILWQHLENYMDWVGTLENYEETMAWLRALTGGMNLTTQIANVAEAAAAANNNKTPTKDIRPAEKQKNIAAAKRLQRKDIVNTTTEEHVKRAMRLDSILYQRAAQRYQLKDWLG